VEGTPASLGRRLFVVLVAVGSSINVAYGLYRFVAAGSLSSEWSGMVEAVGGMVVAAILIFRRGNFWQE
jgi:hypothetical protein